MYTSMILQDLFEALTGLTYVCTQIPHRRGIFTHGIEPEVHGSQEQIRARPGGLSWSSAISSSSVGLQKKVPAI